MDISRFVDLGSYSGSPGWLGYFARRGRFSQRLTEAAIRQFTAFFQPRCAGLEIVSSLCRGTGYDDIRTWEFMLNPPPRIAPLVREGYICDRTLCPKPDSGDAEEDDEPELPLHCFPHATWRRAEQLARFVMSESCFVGGHCFFVLSDWPLIVYPHDDTGYGFIRYAEHPVAEAAVRTFLESLDPQDFSFAWFGVRP